MRIQMVVARVLQDAGRELPLSRGEVYDLPTPVASALLATGAAVVVSELSPELELACVQTSAQDVAASVRPPEGRPLVAPETKDGPRRGRA